MSSPTIDYAALAAQARASAPAVDYSALAQQARQGSAPAVADEQQEKPGAFSRFFGRLVDQLNPLPAIREFLNRPEEIGKASNALHVLNDIHSRAAALPANKGKPVNQWIEPELTPAEKIAVEKGMMANLPGAEAQHPLLQPAVTASGQAQAGDLAGAGGTLIGGYGVPAAVGAAVDAAPGVAAAAKKGASIAGTVVKDYATDPAILKAGLRTLSPRAAGAVDFAKATAERTATLKSKVADAARRYDRAQPLPPSDRVPMWQQVGPMPAETAPTPQAPLPTPTALPSGRVPGPAAAAPVPVRDARVPLWQKQSESAVIPPPPPPPAEAILAPQLPSGRTPGRPALDAATGELLTGGASAGHFEAPTAAATNPAKAAFEAKRAAAASGDEPGEAATPAARPPSPTAGPSGAITAPDQLPPKLITEKQLQQWATDNGLALDDAEGMLVDQNTRVIDRSTLNKTLHAIAGSHETLKSMAGVDSLTKLSDEQMLQLVDRLSKEQAQAAPAAAEAPAAEPDLAGQLQQSLADARARRAPGAKKMGPAGENPGKAAFNAKRAKATK